MDWRTRLGTRLVSVEAAVAHVHSGSVVNVAPYSCTPMTLCDGLKAHARRTVRQLSEQLQGCLRVTFRETLRDCGDRRGAFLTGRQGESLCLRRGWIGLRPAAHHLLDGVLARASAARAARPSERTRRILLGPD